MKSCSHEVKADGANAAPLVLKPNATSDGILPPVLKPNATSDGIPPPVLKLNATVN